MYLRTARLRLAGVERGYLVGCLPEGLFAPNEAGWAIYQRSDYYS